MTDVVCLLIIMDASMFLLHRVAHLPVVYSRIHKTHHVYDKPRPLSLFVLHPLEVVSFGALWLLVLRLYSPSWLGLCTYLMINLAFGTLKASTS